MYTGINRYKAKVNIMLQLRRSVIQLHCCPKYISVSVSYSVSHASSLLHSMMMHDTHNNSLAYSKRVVDMTTFSVLST